MRQKYPLQISCVICDFPLGKYLETLCSVPIIFIEGRMWSQKSLFLFFFPYVLIGKLQCEEIKWVAQYCTTRLIRAETKPNLFSEPSAWFPVPFSLWCPPGVHEASARCSFPGCTHPPIGCIPSPPDFFWSEDCSWKLCCWASPCNSGYVSLLAGRLSWDSKLERIFWRPPSKGQGFLGADETLAFYFILISRAPVFLMDTCNVPEVMLSFLSLQSTRLTSDRSDSLRAKFQSVRDS